MQEKDRIVRKGAMLPDGYIMSLTPTLDSQAQVLLVIKHVFVSNSQAFGLLLPALMKMCLKEGKSSQEDEKVVAKITNPLIQC